MSLSESSLREWMDRLGPRLITLSAGICRNRHVAEEIVQEAFVKLWNRPPDAGEVAYSSWLRRVVTNLSINWLQRTKRPGTLPRFSTDAALHSGERGHERVDQKEEVSRVSAAMDRLDEGKRTLLLLRAHEQMTYDEIAEHLGVPIGTVMSRLNRARHALMAELERDAAGADGGTEVYDFSKYRKKA